ncbi:MAG TPA: sugar phosphate isomerase/epimerase [Firmicutes bacterium]|nr:sugar phosphate isomerase/epimerase [Bacillota bacterium]
MKLAVITGFLGQLQDRFCKYHAPLGIGEKLDALGKIDGVTGAEVVYPYDFEDLAALKSGLERNNLQVAAVNLNLKADPNFVRGSVTNTDPKVRAQAIEWIKAALDAAAEVGAPRVQVALLNDGHDYNFEVDYEQAWNWAVEGIRAGAAHRPDKMLSVEYKLNEPRVRTTVGDVAKGILLCKETGLPNVGLTLDVGHSLYALENPSESLSLMHHFGIKPYIHINDNARNWDWDVLPGTVNLWDLVEFFYYLQEFGYDDWLTFDVYPARYDAVEGFKLAVRQVAKLKMLADRIDRKTLKANLSTGNVIGNWEALFNLIK